MRILTIIIYIQPPLHYFKWIFHRIEHYDGNDFVLSVLFKVSNSALELIISENLNRPSFALCQELFIGKLVSVLEYIADDSTVIDGISCIATVSDMYHGIIKPGFVPLVNLLIGISVDIKVSDIHRNICKNLLSTPNLVENWPDYIDYYQQLTNDFCTDIQQEVALEGVSEKVLQIASVFKILACGLMHDFNLAALKGMSQISSLFELRIYIQIMELSLQHLNPYLVEISN